jgi:SAM-dependent methyltransferase
VLHRISLLVAGSLFACASHAPLGVPSDGEHSREAALRMIRAAEGALAPVYAPLAAEIVADFDLADAEGIGIDIGSGPGTLIVELCRRTRLHWVNADINPHFFPSFLRMADEAGLAGRVSAIFADAQALPFRDEYARVIVSRGSLQFWTDREAAFREIWRVLEPGGVAFVGRGFSRSLPPETARRVRAGQRGGPSYDPDEMARELDSILKRIGIKNHRIRRPRPAGADDINYGVWVQIRKPRAATRDSSRERAPSRRRP